VAAKVFQGLLARDFYHPSNPHFCQSRERLVAKRLNSTRIPSFPVKMNLSKATMRVCKASDIDMLRKANVHIGFAIRLRQLAASKMRPHSAASRPRLRPPQRNSADRIAATAERAKRHSPQSFHATKHRIHFSCSHLVHHVSLKTRSFLHSWQKSLFCRCLTGFSTRLPSSIIRVSLFLRWR